MRSVFKAVTAVAVIFILPPVFAGSEIQDSTRGANAGSALLEWRLGPWGGCNAAAPACGTVSHGFRSRTVQCRAHLLDESSPEGRVDQNCVEGLGTKPPTTEACSIAGPECPTFRWIISGWGSCNAAAPACGTTTTGTRSRTVTCRADFTTKPNEARPDAQCVSALGAKPPLSEGCNRSGSACPAPVDPPIPVSMPRPVGETALPTARCFLQIDGKPIPDGNVGPYLAYPASGWTETGIGAFGTGGAYAGRGVILGPGTYPNVLAIPNFIWQLQFTGIGSIVAGEGATGVFVHRHSGQPIFTARGPSLYNNTNYSSSIRGPAGGWTDPMKKPFNNSGTWHMASGLDNLAYEVNTIVVTCD